jgi:hypothetical protein
MDKRETTGERNDSPERITRAMRSGVETTTA